jgi:molybdopterin-guanine dinucleotide biosynthesis protein A
MRDPGRTGGPGYAADADWSRRPLLGAVLIGGASRRMGRPKQLVEVAGTPLLDRAIGALKPVVMRVVLVGAGPATPAAARLTRVPDLSGIFGPMSGVLAALKWAPAAAYIVVGCDQPHLTVEAVAWLAEQRRPGRQAVVPHTADGTVQPLLACYEPEARPLLEELARRGHWGPRHLAGMRGVWTPELPRELEAATADIDSPAALDRLEG